MVKYLLLEVVDKRSNYSFVIRIHRELSKSVEGHVPFTTVLNVWKEEVYFNVPFRLRGRPLTYRIKLGKLYYWPPGPALCLFYGASEPYTPVIEVGEIVGPLHYLRCVEDGSEGEVKVHTINSALKDVVSALEGLGYSVGTPLNGDVVAVAASKYVSDTRVSFLVFAENYGYHLESDSLFKLGDGYADRAIFNSMKKLVASMTKYLRVDINEDWYAVITAGVSNLSELLEAAKELEVALPIIASRFDISAQY